MPNDSQRQRRHTLLRLLPTAESPDPALTVSALIAHPALLRSGSYAGKSAAARRRTVQRDLEALLREAKVQREPHHKTPHYRRAPLSTPSSSALRDLENELRGLNLPEYLTELILERLRIAPDSFFSLQDRYFNVSDTLRLEPMQRDQMIEEEVTRALHQQRVLKATYQSSKDPEPHDRKLHLIGVIRRGPQHYILAYDETTLDAPEPPVKQYLLRRFHDAIVLEDEVLRLPSNGPTLEQLVDARQITEFARDSETVELRLRVQGYAMELLEHNRLAPDQRFERTQDHQSALVTASVVRSGTLLRWLLAFGANIEVLAPAELRQIVAHQAQSMRHMYDGLN